MLVLTFSQYDIAFILHFHVPVSTNCYVHFPSKRDTKDGAILFHNTVSLYGAQELSYRWVTAINYSTNKCMHDCFQLESNGVVLKVRADGCTFTANWSCGYLQ